MRYEDMTIREQRLFKLSSCPMCGKNLDIIEDVQIIKMRYGKRIIPFFIHSSCLLNSLLSSQLGPVEKEVEYEEN